MEESKTQALLDLARKQGVVRSADLRPQGIPREYLSKLHREGLLERVSRGVYYLLDTDLTEQHSLAEAIKIVPRGVVCLLSAWVACMRLLGHAVVRPPRAPTFLG